MSAVQICSAPGKFDAEEANQSAISFPSLRVCFNRMDWKFLSIEVISAQCLADFQFPCGYN